MTTEMHFNSHVRRIIGATVSSFVNLVEVPFSVVVAWIVLAEMPVYMQILGGVLVLAGVVFIKLGENRACLLYTSPSPRD